MQCGLRPITSSTFSSSQATNNRTTNKQIPQSWSQRRMATTIIRTAAVRRWQPRQCDHRPSTIQRIPFNLESSLHIELRTNTATQTTNTIIGAKMSSTSTSSLALRTLSPSHLQELPPSFMDTFLLADGWRSREHGITDQEVFILLCWEIPLTIGTRLYISWVKVDLQRYGWSGIR